MTPPAQSPRAGPPRPTTRTVLLGLTVAGALALATCSSSEDPAPDGAPGPPPPAAEVEPAPAPAAAPLTQTAPAPTALSVVFELGAPGDSPASDIGAQRVQLAGGQPLWADDHVVVVSESAYHERNVVAVSDGVGGLVAVYEAEVPEGPLKGDVDLLAQRVDETGKLLWAGGTQSVVLASTGVVERAPVLVSDGHGGAWVIFERHGHDEHDALDSDLAAQHVTADGKLAWAGGSHDGLPIAAGPGLAAAPTAVADGQGGLIVAFELELTDGPRAGSRQIRAQRTAADGAPLWGQDGEALVVASAVGSLSHATVLPDGAGGAHVFFLEEVVSGEHAGDQDLMVQRVAADGTLSWSADPDAYKVVSATTLREAVPAVVSDGAGGAIVAFMATWTAGPRTGGQDLFAQRMGPDGAGLWNDGSPVPLASSDWNESSPLLVGDGAGGAIAVFEQAPPAAHLSKDRDLGAQRIGPTGALLWHGGERSAVLSATTHLERHPSAVSDGAGGVVVFFEAVARDGAHAGDSELVAQRLGPAGDRRWGDGSAPELVAYSAAMERRPAVVAP